MTDQKDNKKLYIGIAVALIIVVAIVIGVLLANKGNNDSGGGNNDNGGGEISQVDDGMIEADDLKDVDVVVEYGDYDAMEELAKDIQDGYAVGKVVKVEGLVSHPGSIYSIVELNEDGTAKIGTQFIIEGEGEYPGDGDRIVMTGKVVEMAPLYYTIKTLPGFIEIREVD